MKKNAFKIVILSALLLLAFAFAEAAAAQCAMCKASAEANLKNGGGDPRGLNAGILYMLSLPYLLVFGIGYWWWRNRNKERQEIGDAENDLARFN
jgi:hypothetical protein